MSDCHKSQSGFHQTDTHLKLAWEQFRFGLTFALLSQSGSHCICKNAWAVSLPVWQPAELTKYLSALRLPVLPSSHSFCRSLCKRKEWGSFKAVEEEANLNLYLRQLAPLVHSSAEKPQDICGVVGTYAALYERARWHAQIYSTRSAQVVQPLRLHIPNLNVQV